MFAVYHRQVGGLFVNWCVYVFFPRIRYSEWVNVHTNSLVDS